eukprot:1050899_1
MMGEDEPRKQRIKTQIRTKHESKHKESKHKSKQRIKNKAYTVMDPKSGHGYTRVHPHRGDDGTDMIDKSSAIRATNVCIMHMALKTIIKVGWDLPHFASKFTVWFAILW